ncbi:hypothetical protein NPIL_577481 [Nephila pilipes]|uniref:Uncharacterized protein n=1 Tax=Nephila pilipes TaxID=299642 RepID=A0A8X6PBZ0_NEPPI|nr:hypothetical protein NPIL_577481 [Nephila pilipes]
MALGSHPLPYLVTMRVLNHGVTFKPDTRNGSKDAISNLPQLVINLAACRFPQKLGNATACNSHFLFPYFYVIHFGNPILAPIFVWGG